MSETILSRVLATIEAAVHAAGFGTMGSPGDVVEADGAPAVLVYPHSEDAEAETFGDDEADPGAVKRSPLLVVQLRLPGVWRDAEPSRQAIVGAVVGADYQGLVRRLWEHRTEWDYANATNRVVALHIAFGVEYQTPANDLTTLHRG